jgi:putative nucleotidyltransferase with HDIG domain
LLKQIPPDQLRLGMYIQGFEGSWMDHPFWRSRFVLEDPKDLERVLASGVTGVWIDTSLGADVAAGAPPAPPPSPPASPAAAPAAEVAPPPAAGPRPAPRSMSDEMNRAAAICLAAREQMTAMFNEARMGRALDTGSVRQLVDDISDSVLRNGHALISLARLKTADNYTYMHSVAVCALMVSLARQLGLPAEDVRAAGFAGLVHDIGKAAVPQEVLNKPGRLTDDEFAQVKAHPRLGWDMLRGGGVTDSAALDVCLHHHERMDGAGYPERLAGEGISLIARMGAVCDVYDAITSNRPDKAGWDPAESLSRMAQWSGGHFDPRVFQAFVRSLGIYPVGSLVLLNSARLAVVVEQSTRSLLKPVVKAFYSVRHQERIPPQLVDLSDPKTKVQILQREDPANWSFPDLDQIWSSGLAPVG